jgi:CheY-like chemotaxis protein
VRFTLPRVRDVERTTDPGSGDAPAVLVCDDDLATVETLSAMLARHGYRAIGATSGREALERAASNRPAAVLLDLVLPGTSGAEVLAELKESERTRNIPVVVVSGLSPTADPTTASTSEDWLVKPVSEEQLIMSVAAAVEGRRRDATVLIVEDDEDLAGVLSTLLSSHGLRVEHVSTVAAAVTRGRELQPQVIVLDLELPDGEGTEVLEELRSGPLQHTAVVVYTAADVLGDRVRALDEDTVFLTKARVRPEELEDRVLRLMDAVTGKPLGGKSESAPSVAAGRGSA